MSDQDEWEFDDPRWLSAASGVASTKASLSGAEMTYAERRRHAQSKSQEKQRLHQERTSASGRRQREEEARQEGLETNLIARETEDGRESKAMRIMRGMGFKPGQALGKQEDGEKAPAVDVGKTSAGKGLGASNGASTPPPEATKHRTEPIQFQMRSGRTGLGVPTKSASQKLSAAAIASAAAAPLPSTDDFLAHIKTSMDDRRAFGLLRSIRRTCEELDRRAGMEDSVMWRVPEEGEAELRATKRRRIYEGLEGEDDEEDKKVRGRGELAYESGRSRTVVEVDEEAEDDKAAREEEGDWFSMDTRTRLALTLAYLRRTYLYCFWCGCAYDNRADLLANCPGEDEESH